MLKISLVLLMSFRGEASQVFTQQECEYIISLTNHIESFEYNLDLSNVTTRDTVRLTKSFREAPQLVKNDIKVIRQKILGIVEKYIHEKIYIEYSNMCFRHKGSAHPIHVDNRVYDHNTNTYKIVEGKNNAERHYSAILYLNKCEGGEFCFHNKDTRKEEEVFTIETGKLLFFSSGVENLHSSRITNADRWSFVMFFTRNKNEEENIE